MVEKQRQCGKETAAKGARHSVSGREKVSERRWQVEEEARRQSKHFSSKTSAHCVTQFTLQTKHNTQTRIAHTHIRHTHRHRHNTHIDSRHTHTDLA